MKKIIIALSVILVSACTASFAQNTVQTTRTVRSEQYGNTLNLGLGLGFYGYVGYPIPVLHADYEFDVARSFTLAPFISFATYRNYNYWGDPNYPYRNYYYHETVVPVGVKGTYYFDRLLQADSRWDFYLAASVGFAFRNTTWETGYYGDRKVHEGSGDLYADLHIGTEYHLSHATGLYFDLSTTAATLGLAIHL